MMQELPKTTHDHDGGVEHLLIFQGLFQFARDHTGLMFTIAYLTLILSSMTYLHVLYSAFDISIVKFVALEDILATPIKNPDIIIVFLAIIGVLFISELGTRWNVRSREKYNGQKTPFLVKLMRVIVWVPKSRKTNITFTIIISIFFFATYIILFAKFEAERIKEGKGTIVEIMINENDAPMKRTLLGASNQFIYTYDLKTKKSGIYHVENILKMQPVVESETETVKQMPTMMDEAGIEQERTEQPGSPQK